jgi:hypothetical protein
MKNVLLFLLVSVIVPSLLRAGDSTGFSRIYVSYTPQLNLNKLNIDNNSVEPGVIQAKNTLGQYAAIGIERTTRYGLLIHAGIGFSRRVHNITIVKDMHNYDSDVVLNVVLKYPVNVTLETIDPELMLGYHKRIDKKWAVSVLVGVQEKRYEKVIYREADAIFGYYGNNTPLQVVTPFSYSLFMGERPPPQPDRNWFGVIFAYPMVFKFYLGMEYNLSKGFIKYFTIGVEATRAGTWDNAYQQLTVYTSKNRYSGGNISYYSDNEVSLGLRAGVGLWR